ncbi:MAG: GW dipeptide domain-containing protein [Bacteroidia bacterium]
MKKILIIFTLSTLLFSCSENAEKKGGVDGNGVHTAIVQEVLQTTQYTYLQVKEGDNNIWLAVPKIAAEKGDTYYYKGGLAMHDFESKELNRKFPEVFFIDKLSTSPNVTETSAAPGGEQTMPENAMPSNGEAAPAAAAAPAGPVTAVAEEVLQTSKYTYIRAKVNGSDTWLACTKMDAKVGSTYYFTGGLPMADFESKELKRKFTQVLFLDNISADPKSVEVAESNINTQDGSVQSKGSNIELEKKEVKISHAKGELTIADILQNKSAYAGKKVRIKGQVTKFNGGIMGKNWIHLQDGSDWKGKFDLTITTTETVAVGDNITAEGMIAVDKDFGYGYFYEVLMDDAQISK